MISITGTEEAFWAVVSHEPKLAQATWYVQLKAGGPPTRDAGVSTILIGDIMEWIFPTNAPANYGRMSRFASTVVVANWTFK
jgi:hypothetical protein